MTILSDSEIKELCENTKTPMISPFVNKLVREVMDAGSDKASSVEKRKVISFGLSSFGYDVRLAEDFKIFTNINSGIIDPKRFDSKCLTDVAAREDEYGDMYVLLPPNSYLLGHTPEVFDIPRDVSVVCVGKSSYARAGAIVNVTPIEAGFKGTVVIEISNSTNLPLKIYANEGISQFIFFRGNKPCEMSYGDRAGKYQNQSGIQLPIV